RQQRLALLGAAELGDGQPAEDDRREHRHVRDRPSDLLEQEGDLDEPEPAAADVLRERDAEQVGLGQLGPRAPVEALLAGLDLLQAVLGDLALEDLVGEVADGLLLFAEREVHVPSISWPWACRGRTR